MCKNTLIIVFLVATLSASHVQSGPTLTFEYAFCKNVPYGNYTANSLYEENLKTVISELVGNASSHPFYLSSSGSRGNTVYGQYYCRGDLSTDLCEQCIKDASAFALNCSNARAATVWYDECTLRYANESMFGVNYPHPVLRSWSLENLTNPDEFTPVFNIGMGGLIQEAAHGNNSVTYFATTEKAVSPSITAYFLAQCSPDLSEGDCESCLVSAVNSTRNKAAGIWPTFLYSFSQTCQAMYNTDELFYSSPNGSATPPTATPPSPLLFPDRQGSIFQPPPPPPTHLGKGGSTTIKSGEKMKVGIITIALVLLVLVVT